MTASSLPTATPEAMGRAASYLLGQQHPDGYWRGDFDTGVSATVPDVLLRCHLGIEEPTALGRSAATIRDGQQPSGCWPLYAAGPGDLGLTAAAYVALRIAGDPPTAPHLQRAAEWVRAHGGIEKAGHTLAGCWLAAGGLVPWTDVPGLPVELVLQPAWSPLSISRLAPGGRVLLVALAVVRALRPTRPVGLSVDELRARTTPAQGVRRRGRSAVEQLVSPTLARSARLSALRLRAVSRARQWLRDRQDEDGSFGGTWLQTITAAMALRCSDDPTDRDAADRAVAGLARFTVEDGPYRRVEESTSPVWDTAFAVRALTRWQAVAGGAGLAGPVGRATGWLLAQQCLGPGDWAVSGRAEPGGWAFQFANSVYPDVDDTAAVLLALDAAWWAGTPGPAGEAGAIPVALRRAVQWTIAGQDRDGGWAAWEPYRWVLPGGRRLERMALLERPSVDVTAHAVEALARVEALPAAQPLPAAQAQQLTAVGLPGGSRRARGAAGSTSAAVARGIGFLRRTQDPAGCWTGRWACCRLYGTAAAMIALATASPTGRDAALARAEAWLLSCQNPDGGWGERLESFESDTFIGGPSTVTQTAWALAGLCAMPMSDPKALVAGAAYLVQRQSVDGTWTDPAPCWVFVRGQIYYRPSLLPTILALDALAAVAARLRQPGS